MAEYSYKVFETRKEAKKFLKENKLKNYKVTSLYYNGGNGVRYFNQFGIVIKRKLAKKYRKREEKRLSQEKNCG